MGVATALEPGPMRMTLLSFPLAPLVVAALLLGGAVSEARSAETAVIQEILDGKELYIDDSQASVKEKARAPQRVSTRNSRGQISFESGAVGRINRFSQLKLGQDCFLIDKGQILVSGKQSGCVRSARLSVRGTNYLIAVAENGEAEVSVLEGTVDVEPLRDGQPTGQKATQVTSGQRLRLTAEGVILTILALSTGDYNSILAGPLFQGFKLPLPAIGALESYIRGNLPGVNLPTLPGLTVPGTSLPIRLPRFF